MPESSDLDITRTPSFPALLRFAIGGFGLTSDRLSWSEIRRVKVRGGNDVLCFVE